MHSLMRILIATVLGCLSAISVRAGSGQHLVENKGQWHESVLYRAEFNGGATYIDRSGLSFVLVEDGFYKKLHDWVGDPSLPASANMHSLKMGFRGADFSGAPITSGKRSFPEHFFVGNDAARWTRDVYGYERVKIPNVYPGIAAIFGCSSGNFKYDFEVAAGANPDLIAVEISGAVNSFLKDGALIMETSVGQFKELAPFAYQLSAQNEILPVPCSFVLDDGILTYTFPEEYDSARKLIIDPEISFSTYIGSGSNSFGFTASYDSDGALYAGSITFGFDYPVTSGAYQIFFASGVIDCGISKFSPDGSSLEYSTYLGGSGNESPHSIVANSANELYILGSTGSSNLPTSATAYQSDFLGGPGNISGAGFTYENGSDIFIAKLSGDGSQLLACTYMGGTGNDGIGTGTVLDYNYGDRFRGEIVVDDAGNAYVASVTASTDFPTVSGYASTFTGVLSGIIFKLSPNLNTLVWATYSGGSGVESAISLQLAADNSVYFTGGTTATDLPTTAGAIEPDFLGGAVDGYIGHISANGSTLLACTYNGTNSFDQNYFVQIDVAGDVYVVGQTQGLYPQTPDIYTNPNSRQYVHKLSPDLATTLWSTSVGSGTSSIDFSPSAFLVSNCGQIYISGWGGALNGSGGSTQGLPTTNDAFQSSTDGDDFYIMVLGQNAADLVYASFFGGSQSAEHVDGGTSRFDKNGTVYQAVCAGCFGNSDFPTQPGVWSQENGSISCNLAVMKFKLSSVSAQAGIDAPPLICPGSTFDLSNLSQGADTYLWSFDNGDSSTLEELSYSFDAPGTYEVKLYAEDSEGCLAPDSAFITIEVASAPNVSIESPEPICPDETLQLMAEGAETWQWIPAVGLTSYTNPSPFFNGTTTTEYEVVGSTICGSDTAQVIVVVGSLDVTASDNLEVCPGESAQLEAGGGETYLSRLPQG